MTALNELQQRLVADNHNLIYYCLKKYNLLPVEDYYDIAAIGLCKAACSYDTSRGAHFATFACVCIRNELYKSLKKKSVPTYISLDAPVYSAENDQKSSVAIIDQTASSVLLEETVLCQMTCKQVILAMKPKERIVIGLLADGCAQKEAAERSGYSQAQVSRIWNKFKTRLNTCA